MMTEAGSETAWVVRFHETGAADVLRLEQMPMPEPGEGEVRLRVKAIGLNRAEVAFREGKYLDQPVLPALLGYEAAGVVEAVGPGVDAGLMGKPMSTIPAFHMTKYGVYGEVAIVPVGALAAYPAHFTPEQGTSVWMQYITAYGALKHYGKVAAGDHVLITAASSSVGLAAIELVKSEGAISIATTRTAEKKAALLEAGADHVIVTNDEDLVKRVMEITDGKGARLVFDPVVGAGVMKLAQATRDGGMIFLYGGLSGEATPFPTYAAMTRHLWLRGYTLFELTLDPALREEARQYVAERLESGAFTPKIDKVFKLEDIVEAHRYMESNAQIGKIVVAV